MTTAVVLFVAPPLRRAARTAVLLVGIPLVLWGLGIAFVLIEASVGLQEVDTFAHPRSATTRTWWHVDELPPHVTRAFLDTHDPGFEHRGPMPFRHVLRVAHEQLRGRVLEPPRLCVAQTLPRAAAAQDPSVLLAELRVRSLRRTLLAYELEQRYSKTQLLELLLNRSYFGAGAYGIDVAARLYFGKDPTELDAAEAAQLAALSRSPRRASSLLWPASR